MYWEILLLVQTWRILISSSILLTKAFFVTDILNHIFPLQQQYFSITFNYVRCSMWFKLTSIYLMHYCHFEGQMFLHPMLQQPQLFSIALHRRGSNKRYHLHATHWLDLYSTLPHAQMLPLNYCSLSPFCSNTSTVHWFYCSTWDCYCNILEYLSGFFCKGNAHHVLLSGDPQFQFISFQTCFYSVMEWKAHLLRSFTGSYFAKFLTCRIKKPLDSGLENWRFFYPGGTRSLGFQKCSSSHLPLNGHPSVKHFWEKKTHNDENPNKIQPFLLTLFTLNLQTPALQNALENMLTI